MVDFFFYGTLCHAPLLTLVLGHQPDMQPASLADHAVYWAEGGAFPIIRAEAGARAQGLLVRGMTMADVARLDFYEAGFAFDTHDLLVDSATSPARARVYIPHAGQWQHGAPWSLTEWQDRYGAEVVATAGDFMALYGVKPPQSVLARYGQMLVRGAARVRAETLAPSTRRKAAQPSDVVVESRTEPYAGFFAVEEQTLRFRRFDGSLSPAVQRSAFISGDAVTVLPYDPVRDRVLLIEQFRFGPHVRGDANPWQLEVIAGRIDPGETPQDAARREAVEEAGLTLGGLTLMQAYYPSPGAYAEYLYSYLALADLPDGIEGVFGVEGEAEDIRGHLMDFDALMDLVTSGEVGNGPTLLSALWLARQRDGLRAV